jgi:hypothetical protein
MTEEVVSALMSAADEDTWERASLFDPPPSHLNPNQCAKGNLLSSISSSITDPSPTLRIVSPPFVNSSGFRAPAPVYHSVDSFSGSSSIGGITQSTGLPMRNIVKSGS